MGKFYEVNYDDALICHKELDLHLMFSARGKMYLHTSFPEKILNKYVKLLTDRNYKVAIIE